MITRAPEGEYWVLWFNPHKFLKAVLKGKCLFNPDKNNCSSNQHSRDETRLIPSLKLIARVDQSGPYNEKILSNTRMC